MEQGNELVWNQVANTIQGRKEGDPPMGKGVGRPSKYFSHVQPKLVLIEGWARNGLTMEQIADNLGVHVGSLYEYQKEYTDLTNALKNGRDVIDTMVENALLKSALGYEYEEEQATKDGVYTVRKMAHPNTTALIFWLKNRRAKDWRDKQDIEHSGDMGVKVINDIPKTN